MRWRLTTLNAHPRFIRVCVHVCIHINCMHNYYHIFISVGLTDKCLTRNVYCPTKYVSTHSVYQNIHISYHAIMTFRFKLIGYGYGFGFGINIDKFNEWQIIKFIRMFGIQNASNWKLYVMRGNKNGDIFTSRFGRSSLSSNGGFVAAIQLILYSFSYPYLIRTLHVILHIFFFCLSRPLSSFEL